ncbi:hypothetical protein BR10RB9215_C10684 [Brucella sp. 10RB9215]|nr:hypothetical protein BR10RB9215_C10684 [Brucella sp. 10RB9215]
MNQLHSGDCGPLFHSGITLLFKKLRQQEGQFQRLIGIEAWVAMRVVAIMQIFSRDCTCTQAIAARFSTPASRSFLRSSANRKASSSA